MKVAGEIKIAKNVGPILRGLLNSVKHTAPSFAKVHNLDTDTLEAVMKGEKQITQEIVDAVEAHSPLNARDLFDPNRRLEFQVVDDTTDGVVTWTPEQMKATQRRFYRGPEQVPFYDYADTAMSKTSAFRPEWIAELFVNDGEDPDSVPDWAFNKGHFEFQMTYFIGTVNFHWIDKTGKKYVSQMYSEDMNFITPFVPHTFTTREAGEGLILAVTYGGAISSDEFQSGIQAMDLQTYLGKYLQNATELAKGGNALPTSAFSGILIRRHDYATIVESEYCASISLMDDVPFQPSTKAEEIFIKQEVRMHSAAETWGYNIGNSPVLVRWPMGNNATIDPGGSFFAQSNVAYSLSNVGHKQGEVVIMNIKPGEGDPLSELGSIFKFAGKQGLERVHSETMQWF